MTLETTDDNTESNEELIIVVLLIRNELKIGLVRKQTQHNSIKRRMTRAILSKGFAEGDLNNLMKSMISSFLKDVHKWELVEKTSIH